MIALHRRIKFSSPRDVSNLLLLAAAPSEPFRKSDGSEDLEPVNSSASVGPVGSPRHKAGNAAELGNAAGTRAGVVARVLQMSARALST
jgi:hypothetical protein